MKKILLSALIICVLTITFSYAENAFNQAYSGTARVGQQVSTVGNGRVTSGTYSSTEVWATNKSGSSNYGASVALLRVDNFGRTYTVTSRSNPNGKGTASVYAGVTNVSQIRVSWRALPVLN